MKKTILASAMLIALSGAAFAQDNVAQPVVGNVTLLNQGIYTNLQLGFGWDHYDATSSLNSDVSDKGFSGRLDVGYNFNQYIAAEIGYLYLPKIKFSNINGWGIDESFRQTVVDFLAKGTLPLVDNFDLYAKAGAAWVHRGSVTVSHGSTEVSSNDTDNKFVPVAGIGVSYHINDHLITDASYLHYFEIDDSKAIDFVGIGMGWQF